MDDIDYISSIICKRSIIEEGNMKLSDIYLTTPLEISDLIQEKHLDSWQEFIHEVMEIPFRNKLIWRGQRNSAWEIEPSCMREEYASKGRGFLNAMELHANYCDLLLNIPSEFRTIKLNPLQYYKNRPSIGNKTIDLYSEKLREHQKNQEDPAHNGYHLDFGSTYDVTYGFDADLTQWAWGQHYGVRTPLVDWTKYALCALFFAIEGHDNNDEIAIFALNIDFLVNLNKFPILQLMEKPWEAENNPSNRKFIENFSKIIFGKENQIMSTLKSEFELNKNLWDLCEFLRDMAKLKLIAPNIDEPQNPRLHCQGGLFTFAPGGISVEEWCRRFSESLKSVPFQREKYMKALLTKYCFKIPNKDAEMQCLAFLENANINAKTIYPDFYGLSKYLDYQRQKHKIRSGEVE